MAKKVKQMECDVVRVFAKRDAINHMETRWIGWTPPPAGSVKHNMDGSKKRDTGMATVGGLVRDH